MGIGGFRFVSALEGWGCEEERARREGVVGPLEAERTMEGEGHWWISICECT